MQTAVATHFPPPFDSFVMTQDFGPNNCGVDLSGPLGMPITASAPGVIAAVYPCRKGPDGRNNFAGQGLAQFDRAAMQDSTWGFGFGNLVIVRHTWDELTPESRAFLEDRGLHRLYVHVLYGHLRTISVQPHEAVQPGTVLGTLGSTGCSLAPHLHLEIRLSYRPETCLFSSVQPISPRVFFNLDGGLDGE